MYNIACKDMGMPDCTYVASSETMEGAMMSLKEHGMSAHPAEIQKMMAEGMTEEMMMAKMQEVAKEE